MNRFRKKSDTRRSAQVPFSASSDTLDERENLPQIPLPDDFRTSLILPDLSRRFSLLRSPSGEPVGLDILRSRIAEQRARGAENHISEEEEEMILHTLRGFRSKPATATSESEERISGLEEGGSSVRQSVQSTSTVESSPSLATSSVSSSPSGRSTKRYSNNLFGSGRFRDYTYMRSVTKNGSIRTQSLTPTESSYRGNTSSITESLRPTTPEGSVISTSTYSSPNDKPSPVRSAPLGPPASHGEQPASAPDYRISKTFSPSALKRASMALEEVIKEIEEEAEDEIVMPRSTPVPRTIPEQPETVRNSELSHSSVFEAVMAISSDKHVQSSPDVNEQRASPIPARILPGYIPGMPRPMTPRDFDSDDQRSHSTTPRATSPIAASFADIPGPSIPTSVISGHTRRDSASSQSIPKSPISPLFLQRTTNGRYTPEDINREMYSTELENPLNSTILTRRRPASPLSGAPYQPMAVSSRPGTPSNVVWTTNSHASQKPSGHNRNGSWISDGGMSNSDVHSTIGQTSGPRSLRSPALPDSPTIDGSPANVSSLDSTSHELIEPAENRFSKMSVMDPGSPIRGPRSATPTQNGPRSPTSPTFPDFSMSPRGGTKRSSKQNTPSNLFNLGPIPPLVFSPLINSSRSSLESAGSSYHTWDGEEKDRSFSLLSDSDALTPAWHDISIFDKSSTTSPGGSPDDDWDPEEIVARYAGLRKSDFMAIQEKLVSASIAKEDRPERAASSLRRRRPSTSQSNYSVNGREHRIASPPQLQPPTSPNPKVTAISHSAVDDHPSTSEPISSPAPQKDENISPITRRNRDLAQALFGKEEAEEQENLLKSEANEKNDSDEPLKSPIKSEVHDAPPPLVTQSPTPYQLTRNPSMPRVPQTPQEEAELAREVQQRMNAATLALKKSPLNPNLSSEPHATISRKRINPHQISTPRLVSASTSVDAVPIIRTPSLSSANNSGPSRIGSRFKKLRGTLLAKNPLPTGEEITPYPLDLHSPPVIQMAHYDPVKLKAPGSAVVASATETRFKVPIPSPPASAGPGLKGFMARFRGKQRVVPDNSSELDLRKSPQFTPALPASPQNERTLPKPPLVSHTSNSPIPRPETPQIQATLLSQTTPAESNDMSALRQLFDAANKIGLDQGELNALLARSGSTSSRSTEWTLLTRNNSSVKPEVEAPIDSSRRTPDEQSSVRAMTPDPKANERGKERPSLDNQAARDRPASRQHSRKQAQPDHVRRPREGQGDNRAASVVIRRTIIFPESKMTTNELGALMRKNSAHRRRASATSVSSRSIHDRVPTPPPPRSPTSKRFSNGPSPPMPSLPTALNVPLSSAGGPIEKSNSTYDSLYDMYAGESRSPSATPNEPETSQNHADSAPGPESGAGVELIQLANGETIWSIVNGLRDEDEESIYTGRASFASEYSRDASGEGGLQVFVKEHGRSGSKGSTSSFLSRKRVAQGKQRPETKIFYSPSANIGRLIEDLSQGMDAGSFNFLPNRPGHSVSSSLSTNDMSWTLEERLDDMIDKVRAK